VGAAGTIRVRVRVEDAEVRLSVSDDGCGMSEEVRRQACEPFFTTRAAGEGSGLGLAIVASIVRGHHGTLEIKSAPGQGTEMLVRLPAEVDPAALAQRAGPASLTA
jgi:signal transduction histidine kinase